MLTHSLTHSHTAAFLFILTHTTTFSITNHCCSSLPFCETREPLWNDHFAFLEAEQQHLLVAAVVVVIVVVMAVVVPFLPLCSLHLNHK